MPPPGVAANGFGEHSPGGYSLTAGFLAEAFNILNRTSFSEINNIFGVGAFPEAQRDAQGRVTYGLYEQALAPRQVQLGAKFSF